MTAVQCATDFAASGNLAGLVGALLLGIAALRAIPMAKRLYRLNGHLLTLAEDRRTKKNPPAGMAANPNVAAKDDEWDTALEKMLKDSSNTAGALGSRWTGYDTAITWAGLFLTLLSDALPLLALRLCVDAPSAAVGAAALWVGGLA
jgi:hypothetical protein